MGRAGVVLTRGAGAVLNLVSNNDLSAATSQVRLVANGSATFPAMTGGIFSPLSPYYQANLAPKFVAKTQGVWEFRLTKPIAKLDRGTLTVSVADRQGNVTRIVRTFSVGGTAP